MSKKVAFIVGPALGHIGRSLSIARALASATNYEILFAGVGQGYGPRIISGAFPFCEVPNIDQGGVDFADQLESLLHELAPDLICWDMSPDPWLLQLRFPETPQVYLTNFFLTRMCSYTTFQQITFRDSQLQLNEIRRSRGLEAIHDVKQLYDKDTVILCDPPELVSCRDSLAPNYHIAGPCTWEPEIDLPDELKEHDDYLFISFGSTGRKPMPSGLAEKVAESLGTRNIIWLGNRHLHEKTHTGPFNHHYYSWLPASKVLARSRFAITQGGAGSTYQALCHGVPTGIWPNHRNQEILGSIVQDYGCGMIVDETSVAVSSINHTIHDMRARCMKLAGSLKHIDGPKNAADTIIGLLY